MTTSTTESGNLLNFLGPENAVWSTANAGEAIPGTVTPLNWSVFGTVGELAIRHGFHQIGALSAQEAKLPSNEKERCLGIFFGHTAIKVNFFCEVGDRIPGTNGEDIARQFLGFAPPGLTSKAKIWRYPIVLARAPWQRMMVKRNLEAMVRYTPLDWWRAGVRRAPCLSLNEAKQQLAVGYHHFLHTNVVHTVATLAAIQPSFNALSKLIDSAGLVELRGDLMAGYGSHAESSMVYDMWAISRGRKTLQSFLDEYGFHGPREGEISGTVWREDPTPLQRLIDGYRRLAEDADPSALEADKVNRRRAAEQKLLRALPAGKRRAAMRVLRGANEYVPLRGVGKMVFLSALDVMRATARRIGELCAENGVFATADDVFYLTYDELLGEFPRDTRRVVMERRALVERYSKLALPRWWQGSQPVPVPAQEDEQTRDQDLIKGVGASAGVTEGIVEVVTNPDFADIPDGRILVAPTTDPSWVPLMYLSKALVVDIGGELSHAAVVARELGIPCVVGTNHGSRTLRSGDYCRVDGGAGTIEVLRRAAAA